MRHLVGVMAAAVLWVGAPAWATRTDVVVIKNGNRLTCKVKSLDRGQLTVETDYMGTVSIDWKHVDSVEASRNFEVELENGRVMYGSLEASDNAGSMALRTGSGVEQLSIDEVVVMTEIKRGFFKRLDGSLDFGFNYQKSNNDVNYSLGVSAAYRTKKNDVVVRYNSILSNRNNSPRSFRNVLDGTYVHSLKARWYVEGTARAEQNDELGLDFRTALGGGLGRYVIRNNRNILGVGAGLTSNREQFVGDPGPRTSLEALANLSYDYFIHGDLGADISTHLTVYPSLTEEGRYRIEWDFAYRQEIFADFSLSFSGWYSFDNKAPIAPGETVRQDDYGVVTALGWEF